MQRSALINSKCVFQARKGDKKLTDNKTAHKAKNPCYYSSTPRNIQIIIK